MSKQTAVLLFVTVGQCFGTAAILKIGRKVIWESRVLPLGAFSAGRELAAEYAAKNNVTVKEVSR